MSNEDKIKLLETQLEIAVSELKRISKSMNDAWVLRGWADKAVKDIEREKLIFSA